MTVNGRPHAEADLPALKECPLLGLGLRAGLDCLKVADSVLSARNQTINVCTGNFSFKICGVVPWHGGVKKIIVLHTHTHYTGCPTTYQTRHFFNNSKTNEDIATRFEQEYVRCMRNMMTS